MDEKRIILNKTKTVRVCTLDYIITLDSSYIKF